MMSAVLRRTLCASALVTFLPLAAEAAPASCQRDFGAFTEKRMKLIERINGYAKKRPSATAACATFGELQSTDTALLKWMQANKDWCQLPDQNIADLEKAIEQTRKVRGQACTAAKKEAEFRASGGAPRGAPPPGSGVRLPQGAL